MIKSTKTFTRYFKVATGLYVVPGKKGLLAIKSEKVDPEFHNSVQNDREDLAPN